MSGVKSPSTESVAVAPRSQMASVGAPLGHATYVSPFAMYTTGGPTSVTRTGVNALAALGIAPLGAATHCPSVSQYQVPGRSRRSHSALLPCAQQIHAAHARNCCVACCVTHTVANDQRQVWPCGHACQGLRHHCLQTAGRNSVGHVFVNVVVCCRAGVNVWRACSMIRDHDDFASAWRHGACMHRWLPHKRDDRWR